MYLLALNRTVTNHSTASGSNCTKSLQKRSEARSSALKKGLKSQRSTRSNSASIASIVKRKALGSLQPRSINKKKVRSGSGLASKSVSKLPFRSSQPQTRDSISTRTHLKMSKLPDNKLPEISGFESVKTRNGLIQDIQRLIPFLTNSVLYVRLSIPHVKPQVVQACPACHQRKKYWEELSDLRCHLRNQCRYKHFILMEAGVSGSQQRRSPNLSIWKVPFKYAKGLASP
jgi:hypothetical protein